MENIYIHIENLLVHNDYVVVPGLGGFILQYNPAVLEGQVLKAPHKVVAFNALMHHADGLLAIEYSRSNQLSFREAQLYIENAVAALKFELSTSGRCVMGSLGVLHVDASGSICFEPSKQASFIPDNFYISDLFLTPKHKIEIQSKGHIHFNAFKIMRYAAMLALAVGVQLVSTKLSDTKIQNSASIINIDQFELHKNRLQPKELVKINDTSATAIAPDTIKVVSKAEVMKMDDDSLYHVVVASLGTLEAAETFKKELEQDTYQDVRILKPSSLYRVALKSFENYDEAIKFMKELRVKDEQFASAWVYCKK
ncbi:MAG: SPOR domain-containing protein [Paludibacter sp.]|nr:SPOR domain-containing protein [Paludibacter sp.]